MPPWKLPFLVAGLVVPTAAAFLLGGPGLGVAMGALVAVAVVTVAARQRPDSPIGGADAKDAARHLLIVAAADLEAPEDVDRTVRLAAVGRGEDVEVRVLVPAAIGFLDRWASDVEGARERAQQRLVVSVAALARAGVRAEARVGDEDIVQAVEDQLRAYPATEVVLVTGGHEGDERAVAQLRSRLRAGFHHVELDAQQG